MISLAFMGDVMLGRGVNEALRTMRPEQPWSDFLSPLEQADLRIINLECALTSHRQPWAHGRKKMFHFRADPDAVKVLQAAHIDACSLANNHILDYGEQGLRDTLRILTVAGIGHAGAGINSTEAAQPTLIELPGKQPRHAALLAFTDNQPDFSATPDRPGTNYMETSSDQKTIARIKACIEQARARGAELVIFSNHWGANFVERPSPFFRSFAKKVIELGADIYYGHSAHICQGIEIYLGKPILYDTGNFIDDYAVDPILRNDRSFLFKINFEGNRLRSIELLPASLSVARVSLARGREREAIFYRMDQLSMELGTVFSRYDDKLFLETG